MTRTADFLKSTWTDPWLLSRKPLAKLLFVYLFTNEHCELSGIYEIAQTTLAYETGISLDEIPRLLSNLSPKIKYDNENNMVFVVNYVRHQFMRGETISSAIRVGIRKALRVKGRSDHEFIKIFCEKYPSIIADPEELKANEVSEFKPIKDKQKEREEYKSGKPRDYKKNELYLKFWAEYPRKDTGPKAPYKHWPHPLPDDLFEEIMKGLKEQIASRLWQEGTVPMATTWLNQERWKGKVFKKPPGPIPSNALPAPPGKYANVGQKVNVDG